jgi:hypothetical protein
VTFILRDTTFCSSTVKTFQKILKSYEIKKFLCARNETNWGKKTDYCYHSYTAYISVLNIRTYMYSILYIVQVLAVGVGAQGEGQDVYNCPPLKTDMKQLFCFWPRLTSLDRGGATSVPVYITYIQ